MSKPSSLSRQLAFSMVVLTVSMVILTLGSFYFSYWAFLRFAPALLRPEGPDLPDIPDYLAILAMSVLGLIVATKVAIRMAERIVAPVASVAQAARLVAAGDLTARAEAGDPRLAETAMLTKDFNAMAARLQRMAGDVVAWNAQIAHELRTPLTILRGRLQGVTDGVFIVDDALIESLTKQVDGLSRLVEDLRVVSLFDSGHLVLDRYEVDLADEIEHLTDLLRPAIEARGFSFRLDLEHGPSVVDPVRIHQAVTALIDNARKYADPGPIDIRLALRGGTTELRISDSGPGMSEAFAAKAFDMFSRAEAVRSSSPGSGLGLAVVRAIVEAHGGSARYETMDKTFVLSLPSS